MKVAILGTWHVHAPDYARHAIAHGEFVGFFEREDKLAERFIEKMGKDIPRFESVEALLASDADGVIVCSASSDHTEDIIAVAKAKKNIFTEKVLALTDEDCDKIERAIEENGVSFTISLFQKYLAPRMAVKRIADSGELGKINYLRFRNCHSGSVKDWLPDHFYSAEQCGGGAMIDLGAHGMYITDWILGMPSSASSTFTVSHENARNVDGVEDNAVTVMKYESGAIAINETGFVSNYSPVTLEVFGEHGYVRMEGDSVVKCTDETEGKTVSVELGDSSPLPIVQFLTGNILDGCGIKEAKNLTHLMVMAYN
ncbi:MAG: Gfo/Idh/MocA family oxidoreductase [Clostridia bacterium]|nr:Gfo/Idh/MocA family oxidoreductase [Clostridia bacterium]